jgi:hypothetical protein
LNPWKEDLPHRAERFKERVSPLSPVESGERERRRLLEKLPRAYRESPGLLRPLLEAADELLAAARRALRLKEESLAGEPAVPPAGSWRGAFSARAADLEAGTLGCALSSLAERIAARPLLWNGFEALALEGGMIALCRSRRPAVVFAWDRVEVAAPPAGPLVAPQLLPVGVKVQAVWLEKRDRASWRDSPPDGARIAGEIFWSWGS